MAPRSLGTLRHVPRHLTAAVLAVLALSVSACAEEQPKVTEGGAPAITTPSGDAYQNGGSDGSGADGYERRESRGGIVAGGDSPEPGDSPGADTEFKPPRSSSQPAE